MTTEPSIDQQATVVQASGNVQLIRDGFFLPVEAGLVLLPGDRIISDSAARAVIQFTGVEDALVIEKGAAATFNLEVVELEQPPQWIATDLFGEGVYFDSQAANVDTAANQGSMSLSGLFGTGNGGESTGFPVLETVAALGATAAIYSDSDNNGSNANTSESGSDVSGNPSGNPGNNPNPNPNPDPETPPPENEGDPGNPLAPVLDPITDLLTPIGLGSEGTASPLASSSDGTNGNLTPTLLSNISNQG